MHRRMNAIVLLAKQEAQSSGCHTGGTVLISEASDFLLSRTLIVMAGTLRCEYQLGRRGGN